MGRSVPAVVCAVLAAVLFLGVPASAAPPTTAHFELSRLFDPTAESLLADLFAPVRMLSPVSAVLFHTEMPSGVRMAARAPLFSPQSVVVPTVRLAAFVPPPMENLAADKAVTAPVQPRIQQPVLAPAPPVPAVHLSAVHDTAYAPITQQVAADVRVPVRLGAMHFAESFESSQAQTNRSDAVRAMQLCGTTDEGSACPYLHDEHEQTLSAATNFAVRAGNERLNVQLGGSVTHVTAGDTAIFPYTPLAPDANLDAPVAGTAGPDTSLLYYSGLADVVQHGLNASLAVPVTPRVTVGLQYNHAHYQGDYGFLLAPGLDANKDTYLGNVTYQLPNTNSLITLSARQYRYQDNFVPNFNLTQTRADLSLTVKF